MIDLHCHLLPGMDDGPDTLEQSLELCRLAVADGITRAIVTPHMHPGRWENNRQSIAVACDTLQHALDEHAIALQLGFAAEVRLTERIPEQIASEEIPFYGVVDGYQIMLLEFPHGHVIPGSHTLVEWLLGRGIRPLIAHPERNRQIMADASQLQPFIDAGCWLQLTAGSVIGQFGAKSQALAHRLLADDRVTVLASDGHNARARPPVLRQAFGSIVRQFGVERAQRLMVDTPFAMVAGQFADRALLPC